jgi:hypothetical protein
MTATSTQGMTGLARDIAASLGGVGQTVAVLGGGPPPVPVAVLDRAHAR